MGLGAGVEEAGGSAGDESASSFGVNIVDVPSSAASPSELSCTAQGTRYNRRGAVDAVVY